MNVFQSFSELHEDLHQKIGEIAQITCTPDYAYGAGGFPAWGIMPNSTLMFEIEVLSVN